MADLVQDFRLNRREHLVSILPAFALFVLLGEARALAAPGRGTIDGWIADQDEIARALAGGAISGRDWALAVERLAQAVDVAALIQLVSRSRVTPAPGGSHNDPAKRFVRFLDDEGAPRRLNYGAALFEFAPRNVITPHGHRHMVSAHLVVAGAFRVRNFDRIRDEGEAMVIRPTRDYLARVGDVSTMCSDRDNIHWFVPQGGPATTFDIVVAGLDPGQPDHDIKAIDPIGGRRLEDGSIVAPIIPFGEAARRYTADV